MKACVLTSMFAQGFPPGLAAELGRVITERGRFAFAAPEFEGQHERTDRYFQRFYAMLTSCSISFQEAIVVDGRMAPVGEVFHQSGGAARKIASAEG